MRALHFMQMYFFFFVIACLLTSCGSEPETTATTGTPGEATPVPAPHEIKPTPIPEDVADSDAANTSDANGFGDEGFINGLLKLLDGKWQNESNPALTIEVAGKKFRYLNNNKLTREATISIDPRCEKGECKGNIGWCFTDDQGCHVVTQIGQQKWVFRPAEEKSQTSTYLKVKQ